MEDWAEIRRLHRAENMGVKAIARHLGIARNTVRAALRSDAPPRYEREGPGSAVDGFEPAFELAAVSSTGLPCASYAISRRPCRIFSRSAAFRLSSERP